jgi:hypothetical protein
MAHAVATSCSKTVLPDCWVTLLALPGALAIHSIHWQNLASGCDHLDGPCWPAFSLASMACLVSIHTISFLGGTVPVSKGDTFSRAATSQRIIRDITFVGHNACTATVASHLDQSEHVFLPIPTCSAWESIFEQVDTATPSVTLAT